MSELLHQLILNSAQQHPSRVAVIHKDQHWSYQQLAQEVEQAAHALVNLGLSAGGRVAVYLPKQLETVAALFGTQMAGGVMVPVNPQLKAHQVEHIINDCEAEFLITSPQRLKSLGEALPQCPSLKQIIVIDGNPNQLENADKRTLFWQSLNTQMSQTHPRINHDIAALLYTSGSTGKPKGVVLSHLNMVAGAKSVAQYLKNHKDDRLLAALPLSFDYGLSQLTTAFLTGASVVLLEFLFAKDILKAVEKYQPTALAAVPPLWVQLAELEWTESMQSLRYFTNSGGAMPQDTLQKLRRQLPNTQPYLMYGLTEAFRSTYLPPEELEKRPSSIGKAIPNAEVLVLREDGSECDAHEPGELVHRGVHVSLGYWNAPEKTAERFKPIQRNGREEMAVWSGDTVKRDDEGFLYFIARRDEMIKCSGYRISPNEIEEVLQAHPQVAEVAAFGVPHPQLGQAVVLTIAAKDPMLSETDLKRYCAQQLPNFMQPQKVAFYSQLPKNANGKIDRTGLTEQHAQSFE